MDLCLRCGAEQRRRLPAGCPGERDLGAQAPGSRTVEFRERRGRRDREQALGCLDPRCRRLLTALFLEANAPSYEAIGRRLGMPVGSIGPTRGRCLAKLRLALVADPRWEMPS